MDNSFLMAVLAALIVFLAMNFDSKYISKTDTIKVGPKIPLVVFVVVFLICTFNVPSTPTPVLVQPF